jgi:hypothetical protein
MKQLLNEVIYACVHRAGSSCMPGRSSSLASELEVLLPSLSLPISAPNYAVCCIPYRNVPPYSVKLHSEPGCLWRHSRGEQTAAHLR